MENKMQELSLIKDEGLVWLPHPRFPTVRMAHLMPHSVQTPLMTCALVEMPSDASVAEHVHDQEDDILYVLHGNAVMWVEGRGDLPLSTGSFLRIPRGTRHRPHGFEGGFRAFNIWATTSNPTPDLGDSHD